MELPHLAAGSCIVGGPTDSDPAIIAVYDIKYIIKIPRVSKTQVHNHEVFAVEISDTSEENVLAYHLEINLPELIRYVICTSCTQTNNMIVLPNS